MKKSLLLVLFTILVVSCDNQEKRIARVIEEEMNLTLDDFGSYSPVAFDVEESTLSPLQNYEIIEMGRKYLKATTDTPILKEKETDAYWSFIKARQPNTRKRYSKARTKYHDEYIKAKSITKELMDSIPAKAKSILPEPVYLVKHKYRCRNSKGIVTLHDETFVIDSSCSRIIYREDNKDTSLQAVKDALAALIPYSDAHEERQE